MTSVVEAVRKKSCSCSWPILWMLLKDDFSHGLLFAVVLPMNQGRRSGYESGGGDGINVNPERSFEGTNGEPPSEAGSSPGKFQKPTWQMVQSTLFLSYICEYY